MQEVYKLKVFSYQKVFKYLLLKLGVVEKQEAEIKKVTFFGKVRENPWILSTVVLGILFVITLFIATSPKITGNVISEQSVGQKVLSYAQAQGVSGATIDSVSKGSDFYTVNVNVNNQKVPLMLSLDGKYILQPFDDKPVPGSTAPPSTKEPVKIDADKIKNAPVEGNANAPVKIIEFSDFQCPFCGRAFENLKPLYDEYIKTGKVELVFLNFPLSFHPNAEPAAQAAMCANEQGKFWEMHNKMFANQETLSTENYKKWAVELGLNKVKFDSCVDSQKYKDAVAADQAYGSSLGVSGTPSFFINGVELVGAQPYSAFKQAIDAELAK